MSDIELAVLDQFATRFGKLQKKIGAIPSAEEWLLIREVRNSFSHDYPDDPKLQAAMLNKSYELASQLIGIFLGIKSFIEPYLNDSF